MHVLHLINKWYFSVQRCLFRTVVLHLFVKELQTVSGIYKVCIGISSAYISLTDQRNGEFWGCSYRLLAPPHPSPTLPSENYFFSQTKSIVCSAVLYGKLFSIIYMILQSWAHYYILAMWYIRATRLQNETHKSRTILIKYATFIFLLAVVCNGSVILLDTLNFISRTGYTRQLMDDLLYLQILQTLKLNLFYYLQQRYLFLML